jgi:PAS domain S-box-containing protein
MKRKSTRRRPPRRPITRPRSRRNPAALFTALTEVEREAMDERVRQLVHELQVHAEEITAQNDELRRTQTELEQARARYVDLYDFAPLGFLTVNRSGLITDINIAAAALFGLDRQLAHGLPLTGMFHNLVRPALRKYLAAAWAHTATTSFEVATLKKPVRRLRFTTRSQGEGSGARLFMAFVDVTEERRLEAEQLGSLHREQARAEELSREVSVRTRAEERIKALLERLVSVQEEERRRIARNLHDQLGQRITALRFSVSALKDDAALGVELLQQRIEAIDRIAAQIDRDVDGIAWDLRPASLDDMGLDAALQAMVRDWSETRGVRGELHVSTILDGRLPPDMESHLYRIVQEALNNVAKHAAASRASVLLKRTSGDVEVIVEDDGRGFDVESITTSRGGGMGLTGIQERASLMGGHLEVESTPGAGTTLFVRVPVQASAGAKTAPESAKILRK